jgi:hypothetical protein
MSVNIFELLKQQEAEESLRQIGWEKWADPYGENLDDVEWPGAFGSFETDAAMEKMERLEEGDLDDDDDDEWSEDEYDMMDNKIPMVRRPPKKPMKILATPLGIIPMTEWTTPSKIFNFWVAHTNFRMTQEIQEIIDSTDGVETLDIYTPYRWKVGVGKAFSSQLVKQRIMKNLGAQSIKINEPGE